MTHTFFSFDLDMLRDWADSAGVKADNDGWMTIYLQPIIGVKDKKNGTYVTTGSDYRSLYSWKNARGWSRPSTFAAHYNNVVRFQDTARVSVSYVTMNAGDIYEKGKEIATPKNGVEITNDTFYSLTDTEFTTQDAGLKLAIDTSLPTRDSTGKWAQVPKSFVLAGVKIEKGEGSKVGASGTYSVKFSKGQIKKNVIQGGRYSKSSKLLYRNTNKTSVVGAKQTTIKIKSDDSGDFSTVYNTLLNKKFELANDAKITYYYVEVTPKLYVTIRREFYTGSSANGGYTKESSKAVYDLTGVSSVDFFPDVDAQDWGDGLSTRRVAGLSVESNNKVLKRDKSKGGAFDVGFNIYDYSKYKGSKWTLDYIKTDFNSKISSMEPEASMKQLNGVNLNGLSGDYTIILRYKCHSVATQLYYYQDGVGDFHLIKQMLNYSVNSSSSTSGKRRIWGPIT